MISPSFMNDATPPISRAREYAWACYDVANSAFATTVMAAFFPIFLKQYWARDVAVTESTFWLGAVTSAAALVSLVLAPLLGSWSDAGGLKKPLLACFAGLGILMSGGLFWVPAGSYGSALLLFGLGTVGFSVGMVFYDALLPFVTTAARLERVSSLGVGLGYLGGGSLFALNVLMTSHPAWFGLADAATAVKTSFLTVALWWLFFSVPLFLAVCEPPTRRASGWSAALAGLRQLGGTFHQVRRLRVVALFLLAYWLYIDGVDTIVHMAVDYALAIGFEADGLMLALLITQAVGVPATLLFGRLGEGFGAKPMIVVGLFIYCGIVVWGVTMTQPWQFYVLAGIIGLVQGGVQAMSRALYARIIPRRQAGEFFGFLNLLGKFAAVLGPVLVGVVSRVSGEPRLSILSLLLLFGIGLLLLSRVDVEEGARCAALQ